MSPASKSDIFREAAVDWRSLMRSLGRRFAERASTSDANDAFVADNFAELKAADVFAAGVPSELGGGGASYPELCDMLRELARFCGSTALALSMHTHVVATMVWCWRRERQPFERLLRRIAKDKLVLVTSGASDWLSPSGKAERVDGGWRIHARKIFASGLPAGDLLITQAVYDDPGAGPTALVFEIGVADRAVAAQDNWRALGMRGTGSQDVVITNAFVPDSAIFLRRPAGRLSASFHINPGMIPLPLVYAVYLGIAEAARDEGLAMTRERPDAAALAYLVGEMENDLACARMAHQDMVEAAKDGEPGPATTNRVWTDRTLVGRAVTRVVQRAMEAAGGRSFYRACVLERLFRDVQGARFHRPQEQAQLRFSGRLALGLDLDS